MHLSCASLFCLHIGWSILTVPTLYGLRVHFVGTSFCTFVNELKKDGPGLTPHAFPRFERRLNGESRSIVPYHHKTSNLQLFVTW